MAILISVLLAAVGGVLLWGFEQAVVGGGLIAAGVIGVFVTIPASVQAAAAAETHQRRQRPAPRARVDGAVVEPTRLRSNPPRNSPSS